MGILQNVILIVILFYSTIGIPVGENDDIGDDSTNLFQYGSETYESKNENDNVVPMEHIYETYSGEADVDDDILDQYNLGRAGLTNNRQRWINGTIPYIIVGPYSSKEQDMIKKAMYTIPLWTCVRFVPYKGEPDFVVIEHHIGFGCRSSAGRLGGRQILYLEAPKCFFRIGKVLHEMLHVVGLGHEHSRADRDKYIIIQKQNVQRGKEFNFDKYPPNPNKHISIPYDYNSIMHYPDYAFSKNGNNTIKPRIKDKRNSSRMGQRFGLSVRDALKVNIMYDCYYKIKNDTKFSRVLPKIPRNNVTKYELWNTYFRNFDYTAPTP